MNIDQAISQIHNRSEVKLSDLEIRILKETWDGLSYEKIANLSHLEGGHVRNVGAKLFKKISKLVDKNVSKKSFRSVFENINYDAEILNERAYKGSLQSDFFRQLEEIFDTLGYVVISHVKKDKRYIEKVIRIDGTGDWRSESDKVFVRVVDGEAELSDYISIKKQVAEYKTDRGLLIVWSRISPTIRNEILKDKSKKRISCFTFDEFIDTIANFTPYLNWLNAELRQKGIDKYYVPLASTKDEVDPISSQRLGIAKYDENEGWTEGYLNKWLDDPSKEHMSLLGEFGTGKTWLVLHYAGALLEKYLEAKLNGSIRPRLPLVIPLRDYARALDVGNVIAGFFFSKHRIKLTIEIFNLLNNMGKFLLIFDGFDEMADRVDQQKMINNFWELSKVISPGAKAILTCRTEHFPNDKEARGTLKSEYPASMDLYITGDPPQFEILKLVPFNEKQIRKALEKRGTQASVIDQILSNISLRDLAKRPVMVEMLLDSLPEISMGKPIDISRIYLYTVRRKMEQDRSENRTFTSPADKLFFLCEISWKMLSNDLMNLNYKDFPDSIRELFGDEVKEKKKLDHWHYDMMGNTILIRNDDGDYKPAHRSWLEFFVAFKIGAELGILSEEFVDLARQQTNIMTNQPSKPYTWHDYYSFEVKNGNREKINKLNNFIPESSTYLKNYYSDFVWTKVILDLLRPMVRIDKSFLRKFKELVIKSKKTNNGHFESNILNLLLRINPLIFQNADLTDSILLNINFEKAWLQDTQLCESTLVGAQFIWSFGIPLCVVFSPDSKLLATSHVGGTIRIWRVENSQAISVLIGHRVNVYSLDFNRDGSRLASASEDHTIKLWDTQSTFCLNTFSGHSDWVRAVSFSPDGTNIASGGYDLIINVWDVHSGKCIQKLKGHEHWIRTLSYSPDGTRIASGSDGNIIRLWNIATGKCENILEGHTHRVWSLTYNQSGTKIASASSDNTVRIWNTSDLTCKNILEGHTHWVRSVSFSPNGDLLASGSYDHTFKIWDTNSGSLLQTINAHKSGIWSLSFSPDGNFLATGSADQSIKLWNTKAYKCSHSLNGLHNKVLSIAFSPDDQYLATGSADQTVKVWKLSTGKCEKILTGHENWVMSLSFSPDGKFLASSGDDRMIKVWDLSTDQCIKTFNGYGDWWVRSVCYSNNGRMLVSSSQGNVIQLWNIIDDDCVSILEGHNSAITSVAFNQDDSQIVSASEDNTIKIWDVDKGACQQTFLGHKDVVTSVMYSPCGKRIVSGSKDQTIKIWDTRSQKCIHTFHEHTDVVNSVSFSPNGVLVASGSSDNTIKIWNIKSDECIHTYNTDKGSVLSVSFSSDGELIASDSSRCEVSIWSLDSQKLVTILDDRPYSRLNITNVKGISESQKASLRELGAID